MRRMRLMHSSLSVKRYTGTENTQRWLRDIILPVVIFSCLNTHYLLCFRMSFSSRRYALPVASRASYTISSYRRKPFFGTIILNSRVTMTFDAADPLILMFDAKTKYLLLIGIEKWDVKREAKKELLVNTVSFLLWVFVVRMRWINTNNNKWDKSAVKYELLLLRPQCRVRLHVTLLVWCCLVVGYAHHIELNSDFYSPFFHMQFIYSYFP